MNQTKTLKSKKCGRCNYGPIYDWSTWHDNRATLNEADLGHDFGRKYGGYLCRNCAGIVSEQILQERKPMSLDELGVQLEREQRLIRKAVGVYISEHETDDASEYEDMKKLYKLITDNDFSLLLRKK